MRKKIEKNFWDTEIIGNRRKIIYFKVSLLFLKRFFYKNWAPIGNSVFETDFTTVLLQTNIGRIKVASHHTCEKRKELCYYPTTPKLYD